MLTLLPFVVSAEELRSIEVKAVSEVVFETSPKDSAYPGKRWMTRKFEIRLPADLADREFVIQFSQYPDDPISRGGEVKTPALHMKVAP